MSMRALVSTENHSAAVKTVDRPVPGQNEILIKVYAVSQNPTDWAHTFFLIPPGRLIGCDFAGEIADAGESIWMVGTRVAGWVHGTRADPPRGAFAEYLITENDMIYEIPPSISYEEASTIPLAFSTAVQAMIQRLGLPEPTQPTKEALPFFIYGGTTSVGKYAIQLAKLGGLFVVATGSKKNHNLLKILGADVTVDYRDLNWPKEVKKLTDSKLSYALDCIVEDGSTGKIGKAMGLRGGKIVTLKASQDDLPLNVSAEALLAYSVFGRYLNYRDWGVEGQPDPKDRDTWVKYLGLIPELLSSGRLKPNKIKKMPGGLEGIINGFAAQRDGKVSAEKLCYSVV